MVTVLLRSNGFSKWRFPEYLSANTFLRFTGKRGVLRNLKTPRVHEIPEMYREEGIGTKGKRRSEAQKEKKRSSEL
ncbi:MAG: hypothetical protein DRG71_07800 [Deltaproteobacteria bacterium]|nr:MAG: hypothetical protein DRG71_07800 [Deltaproteobacteria bacterium]